MEIYKSVDKPDALNDMEKLILKEAAKYNIKFLTQDVNQVDFSGVEILKNKGDKIAEIILAIKDGMDADSLTEAALSNANEVTLYDFVTTARKNYIQTKQLSNAAKTVYGNVALFLARAYNSGKVEGVDENQKVVVLSEALDSTDIQMIFRIAIAMNPDPEVASKADFELERQDLEDLLYFYEGMDVGGLIPALMGAEGSELVSLFYYSYLPTMKADFNGFFNFVDENYFTPVNLAMIALNPQFAQNDYEGLMEMFTVHLLEKDVLRHRTKVHGERGVRLVFRNHALGIATLQMREVHIDDLHIINALIIEPETQIRRSLWFDMTDLTTAMDNFTGEIECVALALILEYYGVLGKAKTDLSSVAHACVPKGQLVILENFKEIQQLVCSWIDVINANLDREQSEFYSAHLIDLSNFLVIQDGPDDWETEFTVTNYLDVTGLEEETVTDLALVKKYFIKLDKNRKLIKGLE